MIRRHETLLRALVTTALLTAGALLPGAAAAQGRPRIDILPVSDIRPGMKGIGYTVFEGTRIDTFSVSILGVLRAYRPGASLILARAANPTLERTGIIAGMSGSPIYVDGRLIGALSYTWGFLKEPVTGITPIEEMLDILPDETPPGGRDDLDLGRIPGADEERRTGPRGDAAGRAGIFAGTPDGTPDGIRPIATPVMVAGFSDEALRFLAPWLRERGMVAVPAGASGGSVRCDSLVGGAAVGAQLIRGDWSAAAVGTVTLRDGDRLLAFGHPFTSMGWVDLPLTGVEITTVMPSLQISNKVGAATDPCGALTADRQAGIAAQVGRTPAMIPVRVDVRGSGGRGRLYRYEVVRHRLLTPGMIAGATVSSISSALHDVGLCTVRYEFETYWNGGAMVGRRGNALLSSAPVSGVGEAIDQSLSLLLSEHFRPSRLDSAVVRVQIDEGLDAMRLTGVRPSALTAAPGDSIRLEASFLRPGSGTETRHLAIRIPPSAPEGTLTIRVCDGPDTDRWEQSRAPQRFEPRSLQDLLALYRAERRTDHLYVQLYLESPGAVVQGEEIPRVPRSVLSVMGGGAGGAGDLAIKGATLAERAYDLRRVVNGCETVTITIAPDHRR